MGISSKLAQKVASVTNGQRDFIDIYFTFVNIPIIGRNLLGDKEYDRLLEELAPGEHALMLFNKGQYSFVSEQFIPQTTSSRLSAEQGGFPVDVRDIDFYSYYPPSFAIDIPAFNDQRVFRIKSQSGFDISQPQKTPRPHKNNVTNTNIHRMKIIGSSRNTVILKSGPSARSKV